MKLTIQSDKHLAVIGPKGIRVWLDDFEISNGVNKVSLEVAKDAAPTAKITLTPDEIDIDAAMMAEIWAWQHRDKINLVDVDKDG